MAFPTPFLQENSSPHPKPVSVAASSLGRQNKLTFFTLPICDYLGDNSLIKQLLKEAESFHYTSLLNLFPLSNLSFYIKSGSETVISRPNLNNILRIIWDTAFPEENILLRESDVDVK